MIFDIQRYSIHDGEGIRTNLFFKGCPLRCAWCSNPESQRCTPSLLFDHRYCRGFGECEKKAPEAIRIVKGKAVINRNKIKDTEILRDVCPTRALTISGEEMSVDHLLKEIKKDLPFYGDQGGVTLSGGEPFSQSSLLSGLLPEIRKAGINISVETCLHVPWKDIEFHLKYINVFLADLKHSDEKVFKKFTGGSLTTVHENFKNLETAKAKVIVRIPVIPGFNFSEEVLKEMIDFTSTLSNVKEIHFIPYHTYGAEKYRLLNKKYTFAENSTIKEEDLALINQYAKDSGLKTKIGG